MNQAVPVSSLRSKLIRDAGVGFINGLVTIPIMISFCSIIFRDHTFVDYMPSLVKLVLFSSMIHQITFTIFSTLPFAVGQVQDAGLIFLSGMTADIIYNCREKNINPEEMMSTILITLSLSTALLGVMLIITGYYKLASMMQYLPMPVVGGYLGFIGLFCGEAGISMMTGVPVKYPFVLHTATLSDLQVLFQRQYLILLAPGICNAILLYKLLHTLHSPLTLPLCLAAIMVIFYIILFSVGWTIQDARDYGWIAPLLPQKSLLSAWLLYNPLGVHWDLMLAQFPRWLGMFLVVAFSSSLDVAAIEMELGLPLDYNRELRTVGISNLCSGLTGGFTGSYIFTQTIFSMRRSVSTVAAGVVLILLEFAVIVLPVSVTAFVPKMLFGSLLLFISLDLMHEWLVLSYQKLSKKEYIVCLLTFFSTLLLGVEKGLLVGVIFAMLLFIYTYGSISSVHIASSSTSSVLRKFDDRAVLYANRGQIVTVNLNGYIFFGSAVSILEEVKRNVIIRCDHVSDDAGSGHVGTDAAAAVPSQGHHHHHHQVRGTITTTNHNTNTTTDSGRRGSLSRLSSNYHTLPVDDHKYLHDISPAGDEDGTGTGGTVSNPIHSSLVEQNKSQPPNCSSNNNQHTVDPMTMPSGEDQVVVTSSSLPRNRSVTLNEIMESQSVYDMTGEEISQHYKTWNTERAAAAGDDTVEGNESGPPTSLSPYSYGSSPILAQLADHINFRNRTGSTKSNVGLDIELGLPATGDDVMTTSTLPTFPSSKSVDRDVISSKGTAAQGGTRASAVDNIAPLSSPGPISGPIGAPMPSTVKSSPMSLLRKAMPTRNLTVGGIAFEPVEEENPRCDDDTPDDPSSCLLDTVWRSQTSYRSRRDYHSVSTNTTITDKKGPHLHQDRDRDRGEYHVPSYGSTARHSISSEPLPSPSPFSLSSSAASSPSPATTSPVPLDNSLQSLNQVALTATMRIKTKYLVLDFSKVLGVDATAARSCFLMLIQLKRAAGIAVVFACVPPEVERLLRSHGVLRASDPIKPRLDDALEWCEDQILTKAKDAVPDVSESSQSLLQTPSGEMTNSSNILRNSSKGVSYISPRPPRTSQHPLPGHRSSVTSTTSTATSSFSSSISSLQRILLNYLEIDIDDNSESSQKSLRLILSHMKTEALLRYFVKDSADTGQILYDRGQVAEKVYFIESGAVELINLPIPMYPNPDLGDNHAHHGHPHLHRILHHLHSQPPSVPDQVDVHYVLGSRVNKVLAGGVFGESSFFLDKPHSMRAIPSTQCVLWTLNKNSLARMNSENPQLCILIQHLLLKSMALSAAAALNSIQTDSGYHLLFE
eukprot:gene6865-13910_t